MSITSEIRPFRVLIVDDRPSERLAVKTAIGAAVPFCEFTEASNTDEAQKFLRKEFPRFDLAVIDLRLEEADRDGLSVVRTIKGVLEHSFQTHLIVIVYTAYPSVESACAAYEAGADFYISKLDSDATKKLQDKARELLTQQELRAMLLRQSQAHREAQKAFEENEKEWIEKYGGQFVIVHKGKVVAQAKDPFEADQLLGKYTADERCDLAVLDIPSRGRKNA